MSITRREFLIGSAGAAAGLILPAYYDRVLTHLAQFGEPSVVMTLDLEAGQKLARVCAEEVMAAVEDKGYYLQMPPVVG